MMLHRRFVLLSVLFAISLATMTLDAQQSLPYFDGFEDAAAKDRWTFVQSTSPHKWCVGEAAPLLDSCGLYVSADGGKTPGYTETAKGIAAYTTINLSAGYYNLSFDYRLVGETDSKGVGLDSLYVYWVTDQNVKIRETEGDRPKSLEIYRKPIVNTDVLFGPDLWHHATMSVRVRGNDVVPVRLVFYWVNNKVNVVPPGVCIDNIQVTSEDDACLMPDSLSVSHENGAKVMWKETSASHYQIICKNNNTGEQTLIDNVLESPYNVPGLPKGIYSFWVRGICGTDTSGWATYTNHVLAVSTDKCINFIDIHNPNVAECRYGKYGELPGHNLGCMDFGFASEHSQHTVHFQQGERDPKIPELSTIAPGELASVRLGNWRGKSEAECIKYTLTVDAANPILVIKYAAVLENIGHNGADFKQPRFIIRVTDSRNVPLDPQCLSVEYLTGSKTMPPGWNRVYLGQVGVEGETRDAYIEWKDWTTMGMNLSAYIGRTVNVYLETGDCGPAPGESCYGYAYFSMDCVSDKLSGLTCGAAAEKIDTIWAPKGFRYEWVKKRDPYKVLFTDQYLLPQPGDTSTYICRMQFRDPGREACSFELEAALSPRYPAANASYIPCRKTITFIDSSHVFTVNGISSEVPDVYWDFGDGEYSEEHNPVHTYAEPGKYEVKLIASIDEGVCDSIWTDSVVVTADTIKTSEIRYMCIGDRVEFGGTYLREPGVYSDTLLNVYGCDSISILDLRLHDTYADSVICGGEVFVFEGEEMTFEPGETYELTYKNIKSYHGCDSILRLEVSDEIIVTPSDSICASESETDSALFVISGGLADSVTVVLDDATSITCPIVDNEFRLPLKGIAAAIYRSTMMFYNSYCGVTEIKVEFTVRYPASIITQRWNDVLAIKNSDNNGGYVFDGVTYQWYADGEPVNGQTRSVLYAPDSPLNAEALYTVLITDAAGNAVMSCPFQPQTVSLADDDISVTFNLSAPGEQVPVNAPAADVNVRIFDSVGRVYSSVDLPQGDSYIAMPDRPGVYVLYITYPSGRTETHKVVVR